MFACFSSEAAETLAAPEADLFDPHGREICTANLAQKACVARLRLHSMLARAAKQLAQDACANHPQLSAYACVLIPIKR